MARINLLPWREQRREERKQRFLVALGAVLVGAAALVFAGNQYLNAMIERQNARNEFVRKEIAVLDARIKEIKELKERRQQLLERMKIIQDLQGNRPIIARVFDQLVRTLPDGVHFTELKMTGKSIAVKGAAEVEDPDRAPADLDDLALAGRDLLHPGHHVARARALSGHRSGTAPGRCRA